MSKTRVLTPVVTVEKDTKGAQAMKTELGKNKIRVGLLDNTKPNTGRLLGYVGDLLTERGIAASVFALDKTDSPAPNPAGATATEAVFKRLTQDADFVLTGLGN